MKINLYKGDLPASFKATNIIALDSETMGLNPKRDKLCLVQISNGDEVCHLVKIDLSTELEKVKNFISNKQIECVIHFASLKSVEESVFNPSKIIYHSHQETK